MVLVADKLSNDIGILQTKLSHREGHQARRMGLEAMPLDQDIEGGHGEGEPGVKILPDPVHDFLEVADDGQYREHRLHQHTVLPQGNRIKFGPRFLTGSYDPSLPASVWPRNPSSPRSLAATDSVPACGSGRDSAHFLPSA